MKHRNDPIHLHYAATRLGNIVARGEMEDADASDTIKSWVANVTLVDRSGLQARLHWAMRDQAQAHRRAIENAKTAIRWAVRPLFDAHASAAEIEEAASKANGGILDRPDVAAILREEMRRALKQRRA